MLIDNKVPKIRILKLITALDIGGAEELLLNICDKFDKSKYEIIVASILPRMTIGKLMEEKGISVIYLGMKNKADMRVIWKLYKVLKENKIDILHTHLFHAHVIGRLVGKLAKIPIIISTEHSINQRNFFYLTLDRITIKWVDSYIAVSKAVRQGMAEKAKIKKGVVIHNGMDIGKFRISENDKRQIMNKLGIRENDIIIGTVGRLHKVKGYDYLIKAFAQISTKFTNLKLFIVGRAESTDSDIMGDFKKLTANLNIEDKVSFLGYRRDIPELLSCFDMFVLSSLSEGLPIVIIEAMASKTPVIATEVGGVPEIIDNGVNGILVKPKDIHKMADAIEFLLRNPNKKEQLIANAYDKVLCDFRLESVITKMEQIYDTLAREKL